MSSISINLLLAVLLLAANAFYVAAEFALVKSRGFRVKAMVEQNRFGAHLLHHANKVGGIHFHGRHGCGGKADCLDVVDRCRCRKHLQASIQYE